MALSRSTKRKATVARRYLRIGGILAIIFLPLLIILLMNGSKQHFKQLHIYGNHVVNAPGDTTFAHLPDFAFTSHLGQPFTQDSLRGYIHIADFFFTTCPTICPAKSRTMELLQEELATTFPELKFVSYSVDPATDTLPALAEYARRFNALPHRWYMVRGSADSTFRLANAYLMSAGRAEDGPFHDNRFVLVDNHLRIRGFYQAVDETSPRMFNQVEQLKEQLKVLYLEHREDTTGIVASR